eukprot:gene40-12851_t
MSDLLLHTVVPSLGAAICIVMYATPVQACLKAAQAKSLGDINPIPFAVTVANTIAWLTYGLLKKDPFVTTPNAVGVVMGIFCYTTAFGLAEDKVRRKLRDIMCFNALLFPALGVLTAFYCATYQDQLNIWGLAGNAICLVYYGAPLSTMADVIKTRNSASIMKQQKRGKQKESE